MLNNFKNLGCNISLKIHFLYSHLNFFSDNLGDMSKEQGECFHQDIKKIERKYQGKWNLLLILQQDEPNINLL